MKTLIIFFLGCFIYLQANAQQLVNVYHTVRRGETLFSISNLYKTDISEIRSLNKLPLRHRLKIGEKLIVKRVKSNKPRKIAKLYKIHANDNYRKIEERQKTDLPEEKEIAEEEKIAEESITEEAIEEIAKEEEVIAKEISQSDVDINIPETGITNTNAIAVIIGNKNYQIDDIPEVTYALNDAQTIKNYLIKSLGYKEGNIIYVEDATQANFFSLFGNENTAKGKLYNYVRPNESDVFIYYSGHGGPDPESKKGFFIPTDCDPSLVALNGYSLDLFYKNLEQLPYKSLTVVIDACFSGVSEGGALLKNMSPVFIDAKSSLINDEKAIVFSSAANDQVSSWYPEKSHSLFTYFFLKGLQGVANSNSDKELSLQEIRSYLNEEVPYWARRLHSREQNPEVWGSDQNILIKY
ncbi:caspase family protein [Chondrinema litorale]|uniref:caspase family protein n=1 Tax=Chondrinema litorale TaxID=2994555 RepID=UPI0025427603|nr:caspase family protein [Chondrinema litorale]UZR94120.1 caspase family protein [Chondrinema litorale]